MVPTFLRLFFDCCHTNIHKTFGFVFIVRKPNIVKFIATSFKGLFYKRAVVVTQQWHFLFNVMLRYCSFTNLTSFQHFTMDLTLQWRVIQLFCLFMENISIVFLLIYLFKRIILNSSILTEKKVKLVDMAQETLAIRGFISWSYLSKCWKWLASRSS